MCRGEVSGECDVYGERGTGVFHANGGCGGGEEVDGMKALRLIKDRVCPRYGVMMDVYCCDIHRRGGACEKVRCRWKKEGKGEGKQNEKRG